MRNGVLEVVERTTYRLAGHKPMRKKLGFLGLMLFVGAVVIAPAMHHAKIDNDTAYAGCDCAERRESEKHSASHQKSNHDSQRCLICKFTRGLLLLSANVCTLSTTELPVLGYVCLYAPSLPAAHLPKHALARAPPVA